MAAKKKPAQEPQQRITQRFKDGTEVLNDPQYLVEIRNTLRQIIRERTDVLNKAKDTTIPGADIRLKRSAFDEINEMEIKATEGKASDPNSSGMSTSNSSTRKVDDHAGSETLSKKSGPKPSTLHLTITRRQNNQAPARRKEANIMTQQEKQIDGKPTLIEIYADNGAHSHWELIDSDGVVIWSEDSEIRKSSEPDKELLAALKALAYKFDYSSQVIYSHAKIEIDKAMALISKYESK